MKRFPCPSCGGPTFFENTRCNACGVALAFDPERLTFVLRPAASDPVGLCANDAFGVCNWTRAGSTHVERCLACAPNRTLPDLTATENQALWRRTEQAKHRLVYGLLRFGREVLRQPLLDGSLRFDFLLPQNGEPVMTGHAEGLITLNLLEASDSYREYARTWMGEPYRTLIGHLRHEVAHFYWPRLVAQDSSILARFRALFGHEDYPPYDQALAGYYQSGPAGDWSDRFISAYASSHPWEDWAESWAYFLHLVDALDTASAHGIGLATGEWPARFQEMPPDPYRLTDFEALLSPWTPLSVAINSLNRSLGTNDPSPFILNPTVIEKLRFIHATLHDLPLARGEPGY